MVAKHRITINLDDKEYKALQHIAQAADRSLAWLGRQAICNFIEKRQRNKDIPLSPTKTGNVSESAGKSFQ